MTNYQSRLVLLVATDQRFVDAARTLLVDHRVLAVGDLQDAREIVLGGRVDLALLGPAFGSDVAISQARSLLDADPSLRIVLAADVVTNRLLKAALKGGFTDVLDVPLDERDLADVLQNLTPAAAQPTELAFVVEPLPMVPSAPVTPAQFDHMAEVPMIPSAPEIERAALAPQVQVDAAEPLSMSMPAEVSFVVEPAASRQAEEVISLAPAAEPSPSFVDAPPQWPVGEVVASEPTPVATLDFESLMPSAAPPAVPEGYEQFAPAPPQIPDVLDQVLPSTPSAATSAIPPTQPSSPPMRPATVPRSGPGRVIAVMAGKGGSGKTITVTNLAIAFGLRADPERVAIVDADLQFGDVALMLQMDPIRTLDDVVGEVETMSDERLDAAMLRHESGTRVLPAPLLPVRAGEITAKSVVGVVNRLRSMFDTVIVDTGPVFDDFLITLLEHADDVVTVVDMDLPSVKNAKVALDGLRQLGFDMGRIRLVVNRANSKASLDLVELEKTLGLRIGGSIPSDRLVPQSVNEGIPVVTFSPRSKVARAFHALAESLDPTADRDRITAQ